MVKLRWTFTLAAVLANAALPAGASAQSVKDVQGNVILISRLGGKCMDAEGGTAANDTRIIGYPCHGGDPQMFQFTSDGRIVHRGKCVVVQGGQARDEAQIVLFNCNGTSNEYWRMDNGRIVGIGGKCMDLKGGSWGNLPFINQPVILYNCHGGENQSWRWGAVMPRSAVSGGTLVNAGALGRIEPIPGLGAKIVAAGGGNVLSGDGGGIVAAGAGNIVAAGAGNIVAAGGLN